MTATCALLFSSISITSAEAAKKIESVLINSGGNKIGTVTLTENKRGVLIEVVAKGLTPGLHGMHFHEKSKCEVPNFESAGKHFAPFGHPHGNMHKKTQVGTLPNLPVKADGSVVFKTVNSKATLKKGKKNSLINGGGTSLVVHENTDDQFTQRSGKAGNRVACAEIKK